jgi:hypothetical protein
MLTPMQAPVAPEAPQVPVAPSPVKGIPIQAPVADVATLRLQVRELRIQLTGLQAQWDGLRGQLDAMLRTNPARPAVQQAWADVGVQMASIKGEIAYREARIALAEGRLVGTTPPPPPGFLRRPIDPNVVFPMGMAMLVALGLPVSIAWAKRILRGKPQPAPLSVDHTMRLENIERAIDTVAIEVERVSESQRFLTRILVERPDRASDPESAAAPEAPSSASKMLGAGPVEPISIPQRERVRQPAITPL